MARVSGAVSAWLRQQRQARSWPISEMGRRLREAARDNGDTTVPGGQAICRSIRRWESGRGGVSERYRLHYCKALDIPPGEFGGGEADGAIGGGNTARPEQLAAQLCATAAACAEAAQLILRGRS